MTSLEPVLVGAVAAFLLTPPSELAKQFVAKMMNSDNEFNELKISLEQKIQELDVTLKKIDDGLIFMRFPSDWLDELEDYRYQMEGFEESMDSARRKKLLRTNLNHVNVMLRRLEKMKVSKVLKRQPNIEHTLFSDVSLLSHKKDAIIKDLTKKSDSRGVSVIGIHGVGKRALARAIAKDETIRMHFSLILSPPSSPEFNFQDVLDYITVQQKSYNPHTFSSFIGKHISGIFSPSSSHNGSVLIILESLQSVVPAHWDTFLFSILKYHPEMKVLITTENPRVADVTHTSKHYFHPLSRDECFSLIKEIAESREDFGQIERATIDHMEEDLVDACKGLPLLAMYAGVLLSASESGDIDNIIREITETSPWKRPDLVNYLLDLKWVPSLVEEPHLKRCLAYCSLFPHDFEFEESNLVQFWMAEGFQPFSEELEHLEKTARGYFDGLHSRSVFQASDLRPGEERSYKMHWLAYDLAQNIAPNTFCRKHIGTKKFTHLNTVSNKITRHLSLSFENNGNDKESYVNRLLSDIPKICSKLRTFLLFDKAGVNIKENPTFFQSLTCLRVLDLSHTNHKKIDTRSISKLKYLRYLDLSYTPVDTLPGLSKSPKLQVLKLNECNNLLELPKDFKILTSLISLQLNPKSLGSMPSGIGKLINLQRLNLFIVGVSEGFRITELESMNNLRKSLRISNLQNVTDRQDAKNAKLVDKDRLEMLELEWSELVPAEKSKSVLEGLEPPRKLKRLIIRNYSGDVFPEWLGRTEVCGLLELIHLDRCKALPPLHQLQLLKTLHVEAMHESTQVDQPQGSAVNCQEKLPKLDGLMSLEELRISSCKKLKELPTLPRSLKRLIIKKSDVLKQSCQIGGADWPKISGIHVEIDSVVVNRSEQDLATPPGHQSSSVQDEMVTSNNEQTSSQAPVTGVSNQNGDNNDIVQDVGITNGNQETSDEARVRVGINQISNSDAVPESQNGSSHKSSWPSKWSKERLCCLSPKVE